MSDRLFGVAARLRWRGSRALVPLPEDVCPSCGELLDTETVDQPALVRHGGYGATERSTTRTCRCGWRVECDRSRQPYGLWAGTPGGAHDEE